MKTQQTLILLLILQTATLILATPEAAPAPAPGKAVWGGYKGNSDVSPQASHFV